MTHILVKDNNNDVKNGMIDAGDYINEWMKDHGGAGNDINDFFENVFDEMEGKGNIVAIKDGIDKKLTKQDSVNYTFSDGELTVNLEDDRKIGNQCKKTIPIPEKNPNMFDGYMGTIADHVVQLSGGDSASDEAKKYLLAVVFLNRCQ